MLDVKVSDPEYDELLNLYQNLSDLFESKLSEYISSLTNLYSLAVIEGKFHDNLKEFTENSEKMKNCFEMEINNAIKECINMFLADIDEADSYLYDDTSE